MTGNNIKIEEMFNAGVHFGYARASRHPKMKGFLFGLKNNVEIFDLEKTYEKLAEATGFMNELGSNRKKVLFVGTKVDTKYLVKKYAQAIHMPFVTGRWIGGTLTNFKLVKKRSERLVDLTKKKETGELNKYTKKEKALFDKEISKLSRYFEGLVSLDELPAAIVVVDAKKEYNMVAEAHKMGVPVIGIINTDCNPEDIKYPVPANDNSVSSIDYLLNELSEAYKEGTRNIKLVSVKVDSVEVKKQD